MESFVLNPERHNLTVVKIETDQGIIGYGCATFQQRPLVVKTMIDEYIRPLVIGKDANNIEDIWNMLMVNSYWRNGPVINNAIAGIDMALWDIKGKLANMPLHQLWGGKSKDGIAVYTHADGLTIDEVLVNIQKKIDEGFTHIRCQLGLYGGRNQEMHLPRNCSEGVFYDPQVYMRSIVELFKAVRQKFGYSLNFIHDVHERLTQNQALQLAKDLEPYKLYFLEDLVPPHQSDFLQVIRNQTSTPIAIGELFNNPVEWKQLLISNNIDYIRCHVSQIGGITPALKLAHVADQFGVKVVWHGPSDMTPIGVAVNTHLGYHLSNVALQEYAECDEITKSIFPGTLVAEGGYIYLNEKPGIGIDFDEDIASGYPCYYRAHEWTQSRIPNGTIHTP